MTLDGGVRCAIISERMLTSVDLMCVKHLRKTSHNRCYRELGRPSQWQSGEHIGVSIMLNLSYTRLISIKGKRVNGAKEYTIKLNINCQTKHEEAMSSTLLCRISVNIYYFTR